MRFVVAVTSPSVAERAATLLRREGFLAHADCQGAPALVVVTCMNEDVDPIFRRIRAIDEGAELRFPG
jgi:hypothetical protein